MAKGTIIDDQSSQNSEVLTDSQCDYREAEIADLWGIVVRHKSSVFLGFGATVLLTAIYLFYAQPVYRAEAYLFPPHEQSIVGLQTVASGLSTVTESYSPESVFNYYLTNARSRVLRREYFGSANLMKHYVRAESKQSIDENQIFEEKFNTKLQVKAAKSASQFVTVSFTDSDAKMAASVVNQYIDFINRRTILGLVADVDAALQAERKLVEDKLLSKFKLAKKRRLDRIAALKEASRVAEILGIENSSTTVTVSKLAKEAGVAVNSAKNPLYMRGTKALNAEVSILESRQSDKSFIRGYRDLQEKLVFLEAVSVNPESLSVTIADQAHVPYQAIEPNKRAIAFLGVMVALVVGVLVAFVFEFRARVRRASA